MRWGPIDAAHLHSVLRNPAYCGDYVFLRRQTKKRPDGNGVIVKFRSPEKSIVIPDNHEAYLPRETWQRIQEALASRRPSMRPLSGKGHALLQGLLRCGTDGCQRLMKPKYWGREGLARTATYTCLHQDGWGASTHKVVFPARFLDHAVAEHVLAALGDIDQETAHGVIERAKLKQADLERTHRRRLMDADEDVERMRRFAMNIPPALEHARLDALAKYEAAVKQQMALKTQLSMETISAVRVTPADIDELVQLTRNVRALWVAPHRTHQEQKRLLHALLTEVLLLRADREAADVEIVWKGGLRHAPPGPSRARGRGHGARPDPCRQGRPAHRR